MFDLANRLIGISKVENCTQTAALNPSSYPITLEMAETQTVPGKAVTEPIVPAPVYDLIYLLLLLLLSEKNKITKQTKTVNVPATILQNLSKFRRQ